MTRKSQCPEHHPESYWYTHRQCDKQAGHRGKHAHFAHTLFGVDKSITTFWDEKGSTTYIDRKAHKRFMREIEGR